MLKLARERQAMSFSGEDVVLNIYYIPAMILGEVHPLIQLSH